MGTLIAVYSEVQRRFLPCAHKAELKPDGVRHYLSTPLRYCLGDAHMYYPAVEPKAAEKLQLSWARIRTLDHGIQVVPWESEIVKTYDISAFDLHDVSVGNRYVKRQKEIDGRFVPVDLFCSQALVDALAANPDALPSISPDDFEALCAELFVRRGFKVDLFRQSKDGGIDFLALKDERCDPIVFAVQCKQPLVRLDGSRKSVGRPVLQQVYGAAKAWDITGGIVISGSTYSREAKRFAELKPQEMEVYGAQDLLNWISKYRWNEDENP